MNLTPTVISGNTARPSLFGSSVQQSQSFHPVLSGGYRLGQTPSEWYRRAKESLAKYDSLVIRTKRIANQTERKTIREWMGSPATDGSPAERYQTVLGDLQQDVESYTPPAVNAYQVDRRTNRIEKLEAFNRSLEGMVVNAEALYGILPPNQVVTEERVVTQTQTPGWVLPLAVGAGALGIAALVTFLSGRKA